jgi:hypothetical protein
LIYRIKPRRIKTLIHANVSLKRKIKQQDIVRRKANFKLFSLKLFLSKTHSPKNAGGKSSKAIIKNGLINTPLTIEDRSKIGEAIPHKSHQFVFV